MTKLRWEDIYKDFKKEHPRLFKKAYGFAPYGFATILIYFPGTIRMTYNYDTKELIKLDER